MLTGYVDEATKRHLYLNALALISPSLVEGFGIPVLDAACLGLPALASPIGSHREIQAMHDFQRARAALRHPPHQRLGSAMRHWWPAATTEAPRPQRRQALTA